MCSLAPVIWNCWSLSAACLILDSEKDTSIWNELKGMLCLVTSILNGLIRFLIEIRPSCIKSSDSLKLILTSFLSMASSSTAKAWKSPYWACIFRTSCTFDLSRRISFFCC